MESRVRLLAQILHSGVLTSTSLCSQEVDLAAHKESVARKLLPMPSGKDYEVTRRLGPSSQAQGPEAVMG